MPDTWKDTSKVDEYVGRVGRLAARAAGEAELAEVLPAGCARVLDLGAGDGRLAAVALASRTTVTEVVAIDSSLPMLALARDRFAADRRVQLIERDMDDPLTDLGMFDAIVSGFAIHHLAHERKQSLFGEVRQMLRPGGVFANLEVVLCATPELQAEFYRRIERPGGDPQDILASVDEQLAWMRSAGLEQVDCYWRWRGFALLVGHAPAA